MIKPLTPERLIRDRMRSKHMTVNMLAKDMNCGVTTLRRRFAFLPCMTVGELKLMAIALELNKDDIDFIVNGG